jgi:aspartate/methionine/tyrosine aminotransferase
MHISFFLNEGDEVLIPNQGIHLHCNKLSGAVPVYYDLKRYNWEPDFEALEKLDLTGKNYVDWLSAYANRTGKLGFI